MDVIRAKTAGFCMGVGLALQKLDTALEQPCEGRTCTLGPIIHNPQVHFQKRTHGIRVLFRERAIRHEEHGLRRAAIL